MLSDCVVFFMLSFLMLCSMKMVVKLLGSLLSLCLMSWCSCVWVSVFLGCLVSGVFMVLFFVLELLVLMDIMGVMLLW